MAERLARPGCDVELSLVPGAPEPPDDGQYLVIDLTTHLSKAEQVWRVECDGAGLEPA